MGALTDEYMDKLPVVPASDVREIKDKMKAFEEAGVTRMVIPYVPVTEPVVDDARRFFEAWGNSYDVARVRGSSRVHGSRARTRSVTIERRTLQL